MLSDAVRRMQMASCGRNSLVGMSHQTSVASHQRRSITPFQPVRYNSRKFNRKIACHTEPRIEEAQVALAQRLALQYAVLQTPALYNVRYSAAMKEFIRLAILAYECGYTEDIVRQEMSTTSLQGFDNDECLLYTCVVWITLMLAPSRTVVRWSTKGSPVTDATLTLWQGFVSLILKAYFEKRMAWYPVDQLQMEVSAMTGRLETPSTTAEFARLVFSTLNTAIRQDARSLSNLCYAAQVAPQFPEY